MQLKFCHYVAMSLLLAALIAISLAPCKASSAEQESTAAAAPSSATSSESATDIGGDNERTVEEKSVIGDIEKLKKVAEILQTIGEKVIPVLIQGNSQSEGDAERNKSRKLHLIHGLNKDVDDLAKSKNLF